MKSLDLKPWFFVLLALSVSGAASARNSWAIADNVIAVHGTTPYSNGYNYWSAGALRALCGNGARCSSATAVVWDGNNKRWDEHDDASPGCVLARAVNTIPGVNIAVIGHSQGGIAIAHLIHDVANGFAGNWSCTTNLNQAAAWVGNLHSISAPFNGEQISDRFANPWSCLQWRALSFTIGWFGVDLNKAEPWSVTSMTSSNMNKFPSWISNLGSYTIYTSYGSYDGMLHTWDGAWCMGGGGGDQNIHDGVVDKYSARAGRFSLNGNQWLMGIGVSVSHLDQVNDTSGSGAMGNAPMTTQVWEHDFY